MKTIQQPITIKVKPYKIKPTSINAMTALQNSPSVLLVEDNHIINKIYSTILKKIGCRVDSVETGKAALENLFKHQYNLIFMDIGLPDIQGDEVIRQIRETKNINHISPIVVLTAHASKLSQNKSMAAYIQEIFEKPIKQSDFEKILIRYCPKEVDAKQSAHEKLVYLRG